MTTPERNAAAYTHTSIPEQADCERSLFDDYCQAHAIDLIDHYQDIASSQIGIAALHAAITAKPVNFLFTSHWPPSHLDQATLDELEATFEESGTTIVTIATPHFTHQNETEEAANA